MSVPGSVKVQDDDANADTDGASVKGEAEQALRKRNLTAVLGDNADGASVEEEAEWASKRRNLAVVLGGKEESQGMCPSR